LFTDPAKNTTGRGPPQTPDIPGFSERSTERQNRMSQDDLFLENAAKTLTPSQVEKFKAALLSPDRENQVIKPGAAPGQTRARLRIHDPQSGVTAEINHQFQIVNYSDLSPSVRPPAPPLNEAGFSRAGPKAQNVNLKTEFVPSHKPSWKSERIVSPTEGKTTTLIGNYKSDMQHILGEFKYPKTTDFGPKEGGFNLLNVPDDVTIGVDFWKQFNEPWLKQATNRGDDVVVMSNPSDQALLSKGGRRTGFGREVDFMNRLVSEGKYDFIAEEGKYVHRR
jgi:hypothetical protein